MKTIWFGLAALAWLGAPAFAQGLAPGDRQAVIDAVAAHLATDYVEAEASGKDAAGALKAAFEAGEFDQAEDGEAFAALVGARLRALTGDGHLNVEYAEEEIADSDEAEEAFDGAQMERWYGAHRNYGVQKIERLEGNVGYLDLRVFAPIDMGGETVAAAMTVVADTDALIIDLRHNSGGIGDMADLVASYLFGTERQPLTGTYDRPTDTLTQRFTQPMVPGKRFGPDKPVYVLIAERTFSAAEALAYNLQALDRATIVGEPSGGGAHPFEYVRIHPNFVLWSVTAKSVNPITKSNWQGVGVFPDVVVESDQALQRALEELALDDKEDADR
ncbi:S41 family peptidase [Parvularcula oceani]|uniref:S41 family peptidase n=1 Tax=Parvularcula oceani TaxID=1247963 RepID=UPI00068FEF9B|nr:S41 family peptidase [Parvularcula oceani]